MHFTKNIHFEGKAVEFTFSLLNSFPGERTFILVEGANQPVLLERIDDHIWKIISSVSSAMLEAEPLLAEAISNYEAGAASDPDS